MKSHEQVPSLDLTYKSGSNYKLSLTLSLKIGICTSHTNQSIPPSSAVQWSIHKSLGLGEAVVIQSGYYNLRLI